MFYHPSKDQGQQTKTDNPNEKQQSKHKQHAKTKAEGSLANWAMPGGCVF
jgi:hypothetical protein